MVAWRALPILLLLALSVLAGCVTKQSETPFDGALQAPPLDPLAAGKTTFQSFGYSFGEIQVRGGPAMVGYPVPVRGEIHIPDTDAPAPLVVMMHGRHGTCGALGTEILLPRCPATPATTPVDSYLGYRYLAEFLASHGFVVASIDANEINSLDSTGVSFQPDYGMPARAQLVKATLDGLRARHEAAQGSALGGDGIDDRLVGRLDLQRIGLMGHSRGGEGVVAALPDLQDYSIGAVFTLAPTAFEERFLTQGHFATLLPYCDGDVHTLHGARFYDAFHGSVSGGDLYQYVVPGANHNWFNTIWTGDDAGWMADDPFCGTGDGSARLTMDEQRDLGLALMASFFRYHLGDVRELRWFLQGELLADEVCPVADGCAEAVLTSWYPREAKTIVEAGDRLAGLNDMDRPQAFRGATNVESCPPPECPEEATVVGTAHRFVVTAEDGFTYRTELGDPLRPWHAISFRAAATGGTPRLDVHVEEVSGRALTYTNVSAPALRPPPGDEEIQRVVLNEVRVPLGLFTGMRWENVKSFELRFAAGARFQVHLADVVLQGE